MGAVYSVELHLSYEDKLTSKQVLSTYLESLLKRGVQFMGKYKKDSSVEEMMELFLSAEQCDYCYEKDNEYDYFDSGFSATYSWSEILDDMFDVLLPYLNDGSYYFQQCDNDIDEYIVKKGRKILTFSSWR